eukprot:SAG11_NODE_7344_length_1158_cov_1.066100_2_plen_279_part_01
MVGQSLHVNQSTMTGKPVISTLGDPVVDGAGQILSARALYFDWVLVGTEEQSRAWEDAFHMITSNGRSYFEHTPQLQVLTNSAGAYHKAVNSAILGMIPFFLASAFAMQCYIFMSFGRRDMVKSQVTLGLCGEVTILMSSIAAVGIYSAVGYQVTHISVTVLFLLMGIGLDDMFVLMKAYERENGKAAEERLSAAVRVAGSSIMMTTVTNVTAFAVGSTMPFPAVSGFCVLLALGASFTFIFFITFFVACIVLDGERQQVGKTDLILGPLQAMNFFCRF